MMFFPVNALRLLESAMNAGKGRLATMELDFPKMGDGLSDSIQGSTADPSPFVYDERSFNRMLARERKRTERS